MRIALIGYGKMGKEIEKIALERGHEIVARIDITTEDTFEGEAFQLADVAIEFTRPEAAYNNYLKCFENNKPVVSGTTGWLDKIDEIKNFCSQKGQTFFYASNFSLGVNIFFEINKKLAGLMNSTDGYNVSMEEVHHTQKLDAPSGTAISLAEDIISNFNSKSGWELDEDNKQIQNDQIGIKAIREGQVPGIHTIKYESEVDEIMIHHSAKSRKGFAFGAVLAAEFANQNQGYLSMSDLLKL